MKKFLYLRIVAIITLTSMTSTMMYLAYGSVRRNTWIWVSLIDLFMALFVAHSASVLYIYHCCYPDKELSRATDLVYRITSYACGTVCFVFLIGVIIGVSTEPEKDRNSWIAIMLMALFTAVFAVQLYGGRQLFRTIRRNVRQQLENSF